MCKPRDGPGSRPLTHDTRPRAASSPRAARPSGRRCSAPSRLRISSAHGAAHAPPLAAASSRHQWRVAVCRRYMPGIGRNSNVSMVPPGARKCGWPARGSERRAEIDDRGAGALRPLHPRRHFGLRLLRRVAGHDLGGTHRRAVEDETLLHRSESLVATPIVASEDRHPPVVSPAAAAGRSVPPGDTLVPSRSRDSG